MPIVVLNGDRGRRLFVDVQKSVDEQKRKRGSVQLRIRESDPLEGTFSPGEGCDEAITIVGDDDIASLIGILMVAAEDRGVVVAELRKHIARERLGMMRRLARRPKRKIKRKTLD